MSARLNPILKLTLACAIAALAGCEAPVSGNDPLAWLNPKQKETESRAATPSAPRTRLQPADSALSRMTGTDNGLAIRRWVVADDEQRIREVLMRHAVGDVVHDSADQHLQRNGFRLIRVPAESLEQILSELGGASLDVTAWHGQVYDWRTIASHGIGAGGQPMAIDGRVRHYTAGEMRLVMRSWIVAMEDGPVVQFELVPQFHKPQRTEVNLLLGREPPPPVESYPSMAVDHLLESGAAYLLTCAPPQSDWSAPSADEPAKVKTPAKPPVRRVGGAVGPSDLVGPEATPPQTIGQWMLSSDTGRASRIMLVLLPRIAERLFPPDATRAQGQPVE